MLIDVERAFYPYQDDDVPMLDAQIQRAKTQHVDATVVGGKVVYEHGRFAHADRDAVLAEIAEAMDRPRTPAEDTSRELRRPVFPHVQAFYADYLAGEPARTPVYAPSART